MNVIRLSGRFGILITNDEGVSLSVSQVESGTWRIVRCDDWPYDERVVSALHTMAARPGVELIDPTGLLGGSRYGSQRNANDGEAAPVGLRAIRRVRSPSEPPAPKARHGLRRKT